MKQYRFDRYHHGVKMAQGAVVNKATDEGDAYLRAKALFPGDDCRDDRFVLREVRDVLAGSTG